MTRLTRLEIALKDDLFDPAGASLVKRAGDYLGLRIDSARRIECYTFDLPLDADQLDQVRTEILTNPVTQVSSFKPLAKEFDWLVWVGLRPGVKDNPGDTAREAIGVHFKLDLGDEDKVFCSAMYALKAPDLTREQCQEIASELLANELIQRLKVFSAEEWDPETGVGLDAPVVEITEQPGFNILDLPAPDDLMRLSDQRSLAIHPADAPVILSYFDDPDRAAEREAVGLPAKPTDVELEFISQARSDHCNHNTFRGLFTYSSADDSGPEIDRTIDDLFAVCIKNPTKALAEERDWVASVLWDNAGVAALDDDWLYVITGETHNSPSNMEAYGGSLTGIVGVYRDPMGTGLGSKLILGTYGFCVGPRDYKGELTPHLHPRRLLDGIIEGVKDGGNKSGVPTGFGLVHFDEEYLGKCLVYVTALGIMPRKTMTPDGEADTWTKKPRPGDLIVMTGGRVGKDGIHGVTASSEGYSDKTPAGHVQIGDPYTQKKMSDFLLEARDEGLMSFLTDNGGGGLSSSVGESARDSGGAVVQLDKAPLKYNGLQVWEIWISESQERMTAAVPPDRIDRFMELAAKHAVEATVIGQYTDTGKLHIKYGAETCAYVDVDFTDKGFPPWTFEAEWLSPAQRGLTEPVFTAPTDQAKLLNDLLAHPNMAAKNWILRQYDHEVQGGAVIKPLGGRGRDVPADAVVYRPILDRPTGLALSQCLNPDYGRIDAYHMTAITMDEAVRRLVAVGADPDMIGLVDNFCWPTIIYDQEANPDGKFKAAQLVRSAWALKDYSQAFGAPLLSGKDSMYVDGMLTGPYGERRKVSGPYSLQITATGIVPRATKAVTIEPKAAGDSVYLLGLTKDELGGSALYRLMGRTGANVPQVDAEANLKLYRNLFRAHQDGLIRSAKILGRGGLAAAAALAGMAGELGLQLDLNRVPAHGELDPTGLLYSESTGRLLVTVSGEQAAGFKAMIGDSPCAFLGYVTDWPDLEFTYNGQTVLKAALSELKKTWLAPFGDLM